MSDIIGSFIIGCMIGILIMGIFSTKKSLKKHKAPVYEYSMNKYSTNNYKTVYMVYWVSYDRTLGGSESFDDEVDANNYLTYFSNDIERRLVKQTYELETQNDDN